MQGARAHRPGRAQPCRRFRMCLWPPFLSVIAQSSWRHSSTACSSPASLPPSAALPRWRRERCTCRAPLTAAVPSSRGTCAPAACACARALSTGLDPCQSERGLAQGWQAQAQGKKVSQRHQPTMGCTHVASLGAHAVTPQSLCHHYANSLYEEKWKTDCHTAYQKLCGTQASAPRLVLWERYQRSTRDEVHPSALHGCQSVHRRVHTQSPGTICAWQGCMPTLNGPHLQRISQACCKGLLHVDSLL